MKKIIVGVLIAGLVISNYLFYSFYEKEKEDTAAMEQKLNKANERIEALQTNNDDQLIKVGEKFVVEMFTSVKKEKGEERIKRLQNLSTGKAKDKLLQSTKKGHTEENEHSHDNPLSSVKIKNSQYNKTDEDTAKVIVLFDHRMVSGEYKVQAVNELTLSMKFVKGKWLISDFEIKQKI